MPKIEPSKETPKTRKDVISKRSGVTKIGNNTYYYTGILMLFCYIYQNSEAKKLTFSKFIIYAHLIIHIGPKGESAGDSQDDEGAEEEEEIGHVDDEEDEDMEDERAAGAIGGEEEPWEVYIDTKIL